MSEELNPFLAKGMTKEREVIYIKFEGINV